jgi:demethylsterigmatocystin 6-O-methyltransferase
MRNIFHAWQNSACEDILAKIKAGMTRESVLLIDEIVLPEQHSTARAAEHDIEMMVTVSK